MTRRSDLKNSLALNEILVVVGATGVKSSIVHVQPSNFQTAPGDVFRCVLVILGERNVKKNAMKNVFIPYSDGVKVAWFENDLLLQSDYV